MLCSHLYLQSYFPDRQHQSLLGQTGSHLPLDYLLLKVELDVQFNPDLVGPLVLQAVIVGGKREEKGKKDHKEIMLVVHILCMRSGVGSTILIWVEADLNQQHIPPTMSIT